MNNISHNPLLIVQICYLMNVYIILRNVYVYVCVCVHTWQLESFISGKMAGQCIQQHIHNLACIVNIFIQHLIGGRGRYLNLLSLVEGELETLWEESLTIPTCHDCLANIVILMDIVIRAYRVPRPQFHFNIIYVYIMSF